MIDRASLPNASPIFGGEPVNRSPSQRLIENAPASTPHAASSPRVFCPTTADRPGNSSGLISRRDNHHQVSLVPSKLTMASAARMNSAPDKGGTAECTNPAPGSESVRVTVLSFSSRLNRSGARRPMNAKNTCRNSPRSFHTRSPNVSIAISVISQYPATAVAIRAGSSGARSTISNHPNANSPSRAGAYPTPCGSVSGGLSSAIKRNSPCHGLNSAQTFPKTAQTRVIPTQTNVQTVSGRGLASGSRAPKKPTATSVTQNARLIRLKAVSSRGIGKRRACHSRNAPPKNRAGTTASNANDSATAIAPDHCIVSVGNNSTKPRPEACASAAVGSSRAISTPIALYVPLIGKSP